ncbi:hypothetical protein Mpe_B0109 (plasmid) [Methylibium petroleiphilum PM1]|uniref:Uncharacterized protein n=2 Tax=Methylibium TaxID=316612 RepID=A2SMU9_METPP|nr:hypothetical protein Mpe_B0109 [Methylibium petroleiphilum PM1]
MPGGGGGSAPRCCASPRVHQPRNTRNTRKEPNMSITNKDYKVEAKGGGECDITPRVVVFSIDLETAKKIVKLAALAEANDLHRIESFDYRAQFLQFDPEAEPEEVERVGDENEIRTECDLLAVGKKDFTFSAYIKHTDIEIRSEGCSIADLMAHFGLQAGTGITDAQLDTHLDAILRGGGSALKHYSMAKSKDDMRNALRRALAELGNG